MESLLPPLGNCSCAQSPMPQKWPPLFQVVPTASDPVTFHQQEPVPVLFAALADIVANAGTPFKFYEDAMY